MNETTKTLSSKIPSRMARSAPNTASSAATTAIGRYGCKPTGTVGCRTDTEDDADGEGEGCDHGDSNGFA